MTVRSLRSWRSWENWRDSVGSVEKTIEKLWGELGSAGDWGSYMKLWSWGSFRELWGAMGSWRRNEELGVLQLNNL